MYYLINFLKDTNSVAFINSLKILSADLKLILRPLDVCRYVEPLVAKSLLSAHNK